MDRDDMGHIIWSISLQYFKLFDIRKMGTPYDNVRVFINEPHSKVQNVQFSEDNKSLVITTNSTFLLLANSQKLAENIKLTGHVEYEGHQIYNAQFLEGEYIFHFEQF